MTAESDPNRWRQPCPHGCGKLINPRYLKIHETKGKGCPALRPAEDPSPFATARGAASTDAGH